MRSATAIAHPNIALIKYWGDLDAELHIPVNGSLSMNLEQLFTRTSVMFDENIEGDQFNLNDNPVRGDSLERVITFLDRVRRMTGIDQFARVESENNFLTGAGIASSASGFAALSLAATWAAGVVLDEKALSRLARTGSGSACRSIASGFVEWKAGKTDQDSFAHSIAPPDHWDLADCIVVVSQDEKQVGSNLGHLIASSSLFQSTRVADAPRRLEICRDAIANKDFDTLASIVELDSNMMHSVMMTSQPPLVYWCPDTIRVMQTVQSMRKSGLPVCYTIDAGPNVHVLCEGEQAQEVSMKMEQLPGVIQVLSAHPGGPTKLV